MSEKTTQHNITIIGGGTAGTSCALALARLGYTNITLLESGDYSRFIIGESIPPEGNEALRFLGVHKAFLSEKHDPCYGSCSYWGSDKRGYNDSILSHHGHGWHLDRRKFNKFLAQQAAESGVQLKTNTSFLEVNTNEDGIHVLLCEDEVNGQFELESDFVIDASGHRGVFAQQYGRQKEESEPLICLAARFQLPEDSEVSKLTHIEAQEYGWWYAARLPDNMLLVGLYTDSETIKNRKIQSIDPWMSLLNTTPNTKAFIENATLIDEKFKGYPASSFYLQEPYGGNWIAIGDAASAYDPVTSRGITKSLTDGLQAAEKIDAHLKGNENALPQFAAMVEASYRQYLQTRRFFYQLEKRWPSSPFWKKYQLSGNSLVSPANQTQQH